LKILIITQYFWPENFRVNDIVEHFRNKNFEVDVLTGLPNYPQGKLDPNFKENPKKYSDYFGANIIRIPIYFRRGGTKLNLFFNYFSFVISGIFFGYYRLRKKKYDIVFSFATSPITSAIPAIFFSSINKSKSFIWVLDLWPDIVKELKIIENNFFYKIFSKLVINIYKKFDFILVQSKTFLNRLQEYDKNLNLSYFPSWSEFLISDKNFEEDNLPFNPSDGKLNIVFTGNIGEAQNFDNIIKVAELLKNYNIRWIIVGTGRNISKLVISSNKHQIKNIFFLGQKDKLFIPFYHSIADVLILSLKSGKAISATIPGKLQSYLAANKYILGFIDGEAKKIIENSKIGSTVHPDDINGLAKKILTLESNRALLKVKKNAGGEFLDINFNKDKLLNILSEKFILASKSYPKIKLITELSPSFFKHNFILSGLNLAFLGYLGIGRIKLSEKIYNWPDGLFFKIFFPKKYNISKISGRKLLTNLKVPNFIERLYVVGNLSSVSKLFLEEKFKKNVIHIDLPYDSPENLSKYCPDFNYEDLIICTLPTPKQEYLAEIISRKHKHYKILCLGGAVEMASGKERPVPEFMENIGLEFLWRLRKETMRRLKRLIITSIYFVYSQVLFKYSLIKKEIIK
jgi:glycosyltransferase involved in cell wall biosynthesis